LSRLSTPWAPFLRLMAPTHLSCLQPCMFCVSKGLPDCCTSNPESYSVLAELPNFRLVEMKVPPGGADKPHDHPSHSMYFLKAAKLEITDYDESGKSKENAHVAEVPAGACPIFPAGAHQVKNVGTEEAHVLFIEQFPTCKPCGDVKDYISPFKVAPQCYKVLAENDDYYTGILEMKPGETDPIHHHKDHLIYVRRQPHPYSPLSIYS
jgi:mannose-6-phosphate isomerase-like protein (cupin superfamily)